MTGKSFQRGPWFLPTPTHPLFLSRLTPSVDLAAAIFLMFTGATSVLGNGMVLLVYCRKRNKLRPPELMTINLAVCDLGFSLLGVPFFIISSLRHAWVFGETMCRWYGVQGFVFGIASLLTTCLVSVERCLKICSLKYGRWVEKRHISLSIVLVWLYTFFWAFLPAFGLGTYGPEPYGTSCTINWWRMKSSVKDRIYIVLVSILCFGHPALIIVTSYLVILLTVYRSGHTLASMTSSSSVTNRNKDLRLAKMAAVVCCTFLLSWMPYATVSLMSALISNDDPLQAMVEASTVVTLIPAMLAKSLCMLNPIIYQLMSREFRDDLHGMVFGQETSRRRRGEASRTSSKERTTILSWSQSRNRSTTASVPVEGQFTNLERQKSQRFSDVMFASPESLEFVSVDTQDNIGGTVQHR